MLFGVSFFEAPPPLPEPEPVGFEAPEWLGAPENVLPGSFQLELVLARTDHVAVYVHGGRAFPNGLEFTLGVRTREPLDRRRNDPVMAWHEGSLEDDVIRFGIALADGRKATVFDRRPFPERDAPPPGVVLFHRGGGGGGTSWEHRFWTWPLPPPGSFAFVVEWPAQGLELTRVEIDSEPIRDAATRAIELWPKDVSRRAGPWVRRG
jgi:hypothetical protein